MDAWVASAQERGHQVKADDWNADAAVIWSMLWAGRMLPNREVWQKYRASGRPVIILEVGALRRGDLWRISVNGMSHRRHYLPRGGPGRPESLGLGLAPWRHSRGTDIVICCQRSDSDQWTGMPSTDQWVEDQIQRLRRHTDRPIVVRPHPRQRLASMPREADVMRPRHRINTHDDFDFDVALDRAWAVINHSSHPGIQAAAAGVPVFVGDRSLALPVANTDISRIEDPEMPDREVWWDDLAWTEWSLPEIRCGTLWDSGLMDLIARA